MTCHDTSQDHGQSEYLARVEYRVVEESRHRSLIRKHVKVFAIDFKKARQSSSGIPHAIDIEFTASLPSPDSGDDLDSFACGQEVELLVMPGFARSGLPRSHVLRLCSIAYRLPTIMLLLFLMLLTWICIFLGVKFSPFVFVLESLTVYQLTSLVMAVVMTIEATFMMGCWGAAMRDSIREIHLNEGDFVKLSRDDTTISSGDDSYLRI